MKAMESIKLVGISMIFVVGLVACDNSGPAERAGKNIDQSANKVVEKLAVASDKAAEKTGTAVDKASVNLGYKLAKTGVVIEDAEITAKTKAAILAEPGLKTLQISVDTIKGVVTLSGSVDTQSNSNRAKALAGAVAGVVEVVNKLVIKSSK